jgi:hypothetical protein
MDLAGIFSLSSELVSNRMVVTSQFDGRVAYIFWTVSLPWVYMARQARRFVGCPPLCGVSPLRGSLVHAGSFPALTCRANLCRRCAACGLCGARGRRSLLKSRLESAGHFVVPGACSLDFIQHRLGAFSREFLKRIECNRSCRLSVSRSLRKRYNSSHEDESRKGARGQSCADHGRR